jgi:hypothetical protein
MKRWLAVLDPESGIAQLSNVAIVESSLPNVAMEKARRVFRVTKDARVVLFDLDAVPDGWTYYL